MSDKKMAMASATTQRTSIRTHRERETQPELPSTIVHIDSPKPEWVKKSGRNTLVFGDYVRVKSTFYRGQYGRVANVLADENDKPLYMVVIICEWNCNTPVITKPFKRSDLEEGVWV